METGLAIKVWKMDYSFLIKNYLNPEMWEKTWTLFEYKNFKVTLNIWSIQTRNQQIMLDIRTHYSNESGHWEYKERSITFSMKIEDITFLKRQINTAIYDTFVMVEKEYIYQTERYKELKQIQYDERDKLEDIARTFLDDNNVTNGTIREAYMDAYIEEYAKVPELISNYVDSQVYMLLTDLYLVWLETLEDDPKKKIRTEEIKEKLGDDSFQEVLDEIEEFKNKFGTEEYEAEMISNLEEV